MIIFIIYHHHLACKAIMPRDCMPWLHFHSSLAWCSYIQSSYDDQWTAKIQAAVLPVIIAPIHEHTWEYDLPVCKNQKKPVKVLCSRCHNWVKMDAKNARWIFPAPTPYIKLSISAGVVTTLMQSMRRQEWRNGGLIRAGRWAHLQQFQVESSMSGVKIHIYCLEPNF